jgi:hypothetical protein
MTNSIRTACEELRMLAGLVVVSLLMTCGGSVGASDAVTSYGPARAVRSEQGTTRQLAYALVSEQELGLPEDLPVPPTPVAIPDELPGKRIPGLVLFPELTSPVLFARAISLPDANTLTHRNFKTRRLGRVVDAAGRTNYFNPEFVLVKFRRAAHVSALRVEPMREVEAVTVLSARSDVDYAVLDTFERRQFTPDDPLLTGQWHHGVIGSFQAWNFSLGNPGIRIGIVDTPFQMDHPDLAANTDPGWDVDASAPVDSAPGIFHSTFCAGMAGAVVNNGLGVAGALNCRLVPLNINGAISEMYNATVWAANNGVRIVNISWSGATSPVLESAGYYLKTNANGILVMSAVDGNGTMTGPNQPDVYCISMTDAADNFQGTLAGAYIDFAAPGYEVYSTALAGAYASASGCSYAAPLFSGVAAWICGVNPTLAADDVIGILRDTSVDLGPSGWDQYYGWGRVNFGAAAAAAVATLPNITGATQQGNSFAMSATYRPSETCTLWRTTQLNLPLWTLVTNAIIVTNGAVVNLSDPAPPSGRAFYKVAATVP